MERIPLIAVPVALLIILAGAFLYWRYVWFFRNPPRTAPIGENIVSAADGTVVYVKEMKPGDDVIVIKKGVQATIEDIIQEDAELPKVIIGTFMSPFDVHYNRAPFDAVIQSVRHYPARTTNHDMRSMHFRTLFNLDPLYENSVHIIENERTVTRMEGEFNGSKISCYVVQIAGGHVAGIDSYIPEGETVNKGEIFGMIRIGSQVDLILPKLPGMTVKVKPGDSLRAGESILVE